MDPYGQKDDPLAQFPVHFDFRVVPPCIIIEPLGEGAMGHVYRGRHYNLDVDVAVKFLRRELASNREYVQRFQRELRIAASIKQENLVGVFDTLEALGLYYTVMELVDGETVESRLVRKGPLSPVEALSIVVPALRGLAALHERRVFHRDIKPSNIIVSRSGQVKVADLGIARDEDRFDTLQTHANALIGTPHYMAPEQFDDPNKVSEKADVYAMALTFAFMLRGDHVVEGKSLPEVIRRACEHDVPSLTRFYPDAPPDLVDVFARMTSRDPAGRPDAKKVIAQLNRALFSLNGEIDLADPDASRTFGTAGLPSKLDRSRVQQIKRMMTHAAVPPTAVDLSAPAAAVARNPGAFAPTMVEQPRGQTAYGGAVPSGSYSQSIPLPAPTQPGGGFKKFLLISTVLLMTAVAAGAGALAFKPEWRAKLANMFQGNGLTSTSQPPPVSAFKDQTPPAGQQNQPPTISAIADMVLDANASTSPPVAFTVDDDKTDPDKLVLICKSSDESLIHTDNLKLSGSGKQRLLRVQCEAGRSGAAEVTITATDDAGAKGSTHFRVTVKGGAAPPPTNVAPTISDIADVSLRYNEASKTVGFTVGDTPEDLSQLKFDFECDNQSLLPLGNLQVSGAGKSRQLTIRPAGTTFGTAHVTVRVSDPGGQSATDAFTVTVADGVNELLASARAAASQAKPRWPDVFRSLDDVLNRCKTRGDADDFYRQTNPLLKQFRTVNSAWDDRPRAAGVSMDDYRGRLKRLADDGQSSIAALMLVESLLERRNPVSPTWKYMNPAIDRETNDRQLQIEAALDYCKRAQTLPDPQFDTCAYAGAIQLQHTVLVNLKAANECFVLGCDKGSPETMATAAFYLLMNKHFLLGLAPDQIDARKAKAIELSKRAAELGSALGAAVYGSQIVNDPAHEAEGWRYLIIAARAGHKGSQEACREHNKRWN